MAIRTLHAQRVRVVLEVSRGCKVEVSGDELWTVFELLDEDFAHVGAPRSQDEIGFHHLRVIEAT